MALNSIIGLELSNPTMIEENVPLLLVEDSVLRETG